MDRTEQKLAAHYYDMLFLQNPDAVFLLNEEGRLTSANPAMSELTGYALEELLNLEFSALLFPDSIDQERQMMEKLRSGKPVSGIRLACRGKGTVAREIELMMYPVYANKEPAGFQGIAREWARAGKREFVDEVTGLPDRQCFQARVNSFISESAKRNGMFAIVFIDIDHFQPINDTFGHLAGDLFLETVGKRLSESLGGSGELARFSGDEFTALIPLGKGEYELPTIANRLMQALKSPIVIGGIEINASVSMGASIFPSCGNDKTALMKKANIALQFAKKMGKNQVRMYESWMDKDTYSKFVLASEFQRALMMNEFILHYQPRLNLLTDTIECFEALIRWSHPKRGVISPNEFIPLAEETGFILTLGQWVLDEACRQAVVWREMGVPPVRMAVNVSAHQFVQNDFYMHVQNALSNHKLDARWLEIEITESALMHSAERNHQVLDKLRNLGVHVSIDDFGTGYSSLNYLRKFRVNTLKIDKSFVHDLPNDIITKTIIQLAHRLGLTVVAEGVEFQEQLDYLKEHGCEQVQGYLIGKPIPPEQCVRYLLP